MKCSSASQMFLILLSAPEPKSTGRSWFNNPCGQKQTMLTRTRSACIIIILIINVDGRSPLWSKPIEKRDMKGLVSTTQNSQSNFTHPSSKTAKRRVPAQRHDQELPPDFLQLPAHQPPQSCMCMQYRRNSSCRWDCLTGPWTGDLARHRTSLSTGENYRLGASCALPTNRHIVYEGLFPRFPHSVLLIKVAV